MAQAEFAYSGKAHLLPQGRALVRGTRTSGGGRGKKHVFIEVECLPEESEAWRQLCCRRNSTLVSCIRRASCPTQIMWPPRANL